MEVKVLEWGSGNTSKSFVEATEEILCGSIDKVFIFGFTSGSKSQEYTRKKSDEFQIFIWGSSFGDFADGNHSIKSNSAWGIELGDTWNWWNSSGNGIQIINPDSGKAIAELIDNQLFVFPPIGDVKMTNGVLIYRHILNEIKEKISSGEVWEKKSFSQKIKAILSQQFVYCDDVARILSLAFTGEKNAIVFGPGGHGKSEMTKAVIEGLDLSGETIFQFFGEGMDEARLFGGLNFRKLEEEKVLEYYPEKSFLNYRIAVFEEIFDAPATVLLALKDVLTARELRNGTQRFPMKTEVIICLTNREPAEISELGPAAHALVERFPLQLDLRWPEYSAESYLKMFRKIGGRLKGPELNGSKQVLAEIIAKATAEGNFISPRTAVHAYETVQTAARIRGASEVRHEDFTDLRFIVGLDDLGESLQADIEAAQARAKAEEELKEAEKKYSQLEKEFKEAETPIKALQSAKRFSQLEDLLSGISVPDGMIKRRDYLREAINQKISEAKTLAFETTRV